MKQITPEELHNIAVEKYQDSIYPFNDKVEAFKDGFNEAISQMQPEWVPIADGWPKENQEVEVCFEHSVYHESGETIESGVTTAVFSRHELLRPVFCKVNGWVVLGVTHWKPLSRPPTDK